MYDDKRQQDIYYIRWPQDHEQPADGEGKSHHRIKPHIAQPSNSRARGSKEINDRNYLLLWVRPDGSVGMNATYSKTMMQYLNDTAGMLASGGLKAELTTNSPTKVEGRVFSAVPLKTMRPPAPWRPPPAGPRCARPS